MQIVTVHYITVSEGETRNLTSVIRASAQLGNPYPRVDIRSVDSAEVTPDFKALDEIQAILSAERWTVEDLESIADIVRNTGRSVDEVPDEEEPQ